MRTATSTFFSTVLLASLVAPAIALAASPHIIGQVVATDLGDQLQVAGSVAGLGNEDVTFLLEATGEATTTCTNPAGKVAPGQTKEVDVSGEVTIEDPKNGRINFDVTTDPPVVKGACPNPKWTANVVDVTFTDATLRIIQAGVTVITCTFDLQTSNIGVCT